jgi:hypothetical protein
MQWGVTTTGPDWLVETDYHLVQWRDVIEAFGRRSIGSRISAGILAFLDFVLTGTLWRYLLTNWRYAGFFLYPFVMFGLLIAAAFLIGVSAFKITGSIPIATGGCTWATCSTIGFFLASIFDAVIRKSSKGWTGWPPSSWLRRATLPQTKFWS